MKKLVIPLTIAVMLGLISPGLLAIAQSTQIPHENPFSAADLPDETGVLLSFSQIIDLAASSQYRDASDILEELSSTDIPDDVQFIIDHYKSLYRRLFTTLDNLDSQLTETTAMLDRRHIYDAGQMLDSSDAYTRYATFLLEDIEAATTDLSDRLGVFAAGATSQFTQAHTRLEESLARLKDLVDRLKSLRQSLTERYEQMMTLAPTELSLNADPTEAFVGDSITATGRLAGDGGPLAGKTVVLSLQYPTANSDKETPDFTVTANVTTAYNGSYKARIRLPYEYTQTMTLTASYEPSGGDSDIYQASTSQPATINTLFYPTRLDVSAPENVYPGVPFVISGQVTAGDDNSSRNIDVFLDDTPLAEAAVTGWFSLEVTPPEHVPPGQRNLTVAVSPRGRYSGAYESQSITVSILPIHLDVRTPTLIILPGNIWIDGKVYHDYGPAAGAPVTFDLKKAATTVRTSSDGHFGGVIKMRFFADTGPLAANPFYTSAAPADSSFDMAPIGVQEITIATASPVPGGVPLAVKQRVISINPLSSVLMLGAMGALGWLVYRRRARTVVLTGSFQEETTKLPSVAPLRAPEPRLTHTDNRVIAAYRSGLKTVESITGVIMAPHITLREYLKMAPLPLTSSETFTELTAIAESALYSASEPRQEETSRAERLAAIIREELYVGTA